MYGVLRPLLFLSDAERAHGLALKGTALAHTLGLSRLLSSPPKPLPTRVFGLDFPNPVGLAAGLDKNGAYIDALGALGFGFVEIGTVTPRPQAGNPMPRLFRLPEKQAIINRMGFNNDGIDALVKNVERARWKGVIGINIGKNKDTRNEDALKDYVHCLERAWDVAHYITINISSPNTIGLRSLQFGEPLKQLVGGLYEVRERLSAQRRLHRPVLLKVAPDLSEQEIDALAETLNAIGIDGVIATNTTVDRYGVTGLRHAEEAGGLSGAPVYGISTSVLRQLRGALDTRIPLIGVGGILSGADAAGKHAAGAQLVQCYSGLVYRGPVLIRECVEAIRRRRETGNSAG